MTRNVINWYHIRKNVTDKKCLKNVRKFIAVENRQIN